MGYMSAIELERGITARAFKFCLVQRNESCLSTLGPIGCLAAKSKQRCELGRNSAGRASLVAHAAARHPSLVGRV